MAKIKWYSVGSLNRRLYVPLGGLWRCLMFDITINRFGLGFKGHISSKGLIGCNIYLGPIDISFHWDIPNTRQT